MSDRPWLSAQYIVRSQIIRLFNAGFPVVFSFADNDAPETDVVVTGMGIVTALGLSADETWARVVAGESSGRALRNDEIDCHNDLQDLLRRVPGGCRIDRRVLMEQVAVREPAFPQQAPEALRDPMNQMLALSLAEAVGQAGMNSEQLMSAGCVVGTSKSSLAALDSVGQSATRDPQVFRDQFLPDAPLRMVQRLTGARGPALCPVAACATGLISVIHGAELIRTGQANCCIVGSADASLHPAVMASFHRLGVLSRQSDPGTACRPFDQNRDGFVIGEGAAVFVLESRRRAKHRDIRPIARVVSAGWQTDPTGLTQIDQSGRIVRGTIQRAVEGARNAGVSFCPDVVSVHGTATESNDLAEARGFSELLPSDVLCFGVKGATGHLLGAAGSVEFGLTLMAMQHGLVPPTANHQATDPQCSINVSPNAKLRDIRSALKLSLGFGGQVAAVLVDDAC